MAVERRLTEIVGPVGGQAAHRALAQRPGRHGHGDVHARARAAGDAVRCRTCRRWSSASPRRTSTGRCPATPTCSAPSPSTSRTTCWPTSGCSPATRGASRRCSAATTSCRSARARWPASTSPPTAGWWPRTSASRGVVAELDRRGLQPRLRARLPGRGGHLRDPPVAAGRGDRAVVERGVRLLRGVGRLGVGLLDHAAEEEPGRGGAAARQGAARRRPPGRAPRRDARPPADLQQGHAGGQGAPVRRRRHARAVPGRGARDARRDDVPARAAGRGGRRRDDRRGRRRRHARPPRRAVPPGARDRGRAGARGGRLRPDAVPARAREELARHSDALDDEYYEVLQQGSWLESKVSEGGTALDRVREQLAHARAALDEQSA